jgi:hypothetical protein
MLSGKTAKFVEHTLSLPVKSENIDFISTYYDEKNNDCPFFTVRIDGM